MPPIPPVKPQEEQIRFSVKVDGLQEVEERIDRLHAKWSAIVAMQDSVVAASNTLSGDQHRRISRRKSTQTKVDVGQDGRS